MNSKYIDETVTNKMNLDIYEFTSIQAKDGLEGFNLGADDYMIKPFENLELNSRINAVLRRMSLFKCLIGIFT